MGVESARFHGIVNGESLRNVFCCLLCIFNCQTAPILKTLGQFENLVFVIMSTRENIRLIARCSLMINFFCMTAVLLEKNLPADFYGFFSFQISDISKWRKNVAGSR